jgi:UDP-3-O-[3-hydroxymyristoyl] glucosamine N-acyltransferase
VANKPVFTLAALAAQLGLQLQVKSAQAATGSIGGLATLAKAQANQLSFYHNPKYRADLLSTQAAAVILQPQHAVDCPTACLLSEQPYLAFANASQLFAPGLALSAVGVHSTAVIDPTATLGANISIAPHVVIGPGASIGDGVVIGANCVIGADSHIASDCVLYPNVTLYHDVQLGARSIVHSGVVIGGDGFGFARAGGRQHKIAQLGGVKIGADVEIGACSSIDRGALDDTVIEEGVKIDNQVQIAHNVHIGAHTVICGCSAIAGSSVIGKNCTIAGAVGVINHITICDGVTVTAMSLVNQNINEPGTYSSGTGLDVSSHWRRNIVRFKELDEMGRRLNRLEKSLTAQLTTPTIKHDHPD